MYYSLTNDITFEICVCLGLLLLNSEHKFEINFLLLYFVSWWMTFHEPSNMLSSLWPGAASNLILHIAYNSWVWQMNDWFDSNCNAVGWITWKLITEIMGRGKKTCSSATFFSANIDTILCSSTGSFCVIFSKDLCWTVKWIFLFFSGIMQS